METRILLALALAAAAAAAAWFLERRRPDAPTGSAAAAMPGQLDRADFARPDTEWLVVLFSSRTCDSCADVAAKVAALDSEAVAVQEVEWSEAADLHRRYGIEAVPMTLVVDAEGVVRAGFTGAVTATDLWAAVAGAREAGGAV